MSTNHHTPIPVGSQATADLFNNRFSDIDAVLTQAKNTADAYALEVAVARQGAATLDTRLDAIAIGATNVATLANGSAAAGQKMVTVDSTTGFVAGASLAYVLAGGGIEYNTIDTVDSGTQLTLVNNIGTGGIPNDNVVSQVPLGTAQLAGNYNTPADRVDALDGWPFTMRLSGSGTGTTVNVKSKPGTDLEGYAIFSPFSTDCEVRRISSTTSSTVTLASALANSHADDGAVLVFRSLERLPAAFFGLATGATSTVNKTAIKAALSQLQYSGTSTLEIGSGTYNVHQNGTSDAITLTSNQHIEMQHDTTLVADPEAVVTGNNYVFLMANGHSNMGVRGGRIVGERDDNPLNVGIGIGERTYNIKIEHIVIESCGTGITVVAGDVEQNGTVASATLNTVTLASGANATDDALNGMYIGIITGTGQYQARRITDYAGSTKTATVATNWHTTPTSANAYHVFYINDLYFNNVTIRDCYRNGCGFTEGYNTVFVNCRFQNTVGTSPQAGVDVEPNAEGAVWGIKFDNCVFEYNGAIGLYVQNGLSNIGVGAVRDVSVKNCSFNHNTSGLIIDRCQVATVAGNSFVQNSEVPMQVSYCEHITVAGNVASDNDGGTGLGDLTFVSCDVGTVVGNTIERSVNGHGILLSVGGDTNRQSRAITVVGNTVDGCDGNGIHIDGAVGCVFQGNAVTNCNGAGIQAEVNGGVYASLFSGNSLVGNCQDGSETRQFYLGRGVHNWIAGNLTRKYSVMSGGIAQSATATTAVLDADTAILTDDVYNNLTIEIVKGTGNGQTQTITDYVASTKTITVASWSTQPDNTSHYIIYDGSSGTRSIVFGSEAHANYYHGNDFRFSGGVQDFTGGDNIDGGDNQSS